MAEIIFLHGASSSGKSTLARALQARIERPFWHISIDHLRDSGVLPSERFQSGEFDWSKARGAFFAGFHASLAAYADAGNDLILEHILEDESFLSDLRRALARHRVLFVGVHCPLDVLIEREAARGDRRVGSAEEDFRRVHRGLRYDLDLQSLDGVEENVARILDAFRRPVRRSSFTEAG